MDKQFKRGDLRTLAFNELAAGPGARCPRLTFYLAPGVPPQQWLRGPGTHRVVSQLPRPWGRGAENNYLGLEEARRLAWLSLRLLWDV